ncbi:peptidylprolyl isomerase [Nitrosomonas sp.]|uniref:peptidylprolyl isomerase n=1 Tax=Nitrosomonas sp. TaxID=42353 RepID=UPI001E12828A|nr:peptidylprolyl isomerase [Nitrosomonas sp.]MCB1948058.1 peptidylprolyl isomerase [Nitrosomonas sp.]MCP5242340.1 peptidylprolyl isomerase [Burkholderiales bacterium]MDR4514743.1 peptidylprolyl isomerase [Nitrosomonas sp.]
MYKKILFVLVIGVLFLFPLQPAAEIDENSFPTDTPLSEDEEDTSGDESDTADSIPEYIAGNILLDRIAAIVNEDVITQKELDNAVTTATRNLRQQGIEPPDQDSMHSQVLETLVIKSIQLQHAREIGMSVSDSELDETIRRIAEENKLSLQEFYAVLEQDGISFNKFRHEIRDEIILARLKERQINSQVNVTEGEIDNFLRTQEASAVGNEEFLLAHILITVTEHMDSTQIHERSMRAEQALKKLQQGADFAHVAAEFSDAPDAMSGGVLDWRPITQMGPTFAQLLSPLEIGEITPVVQSPNGFHIFKLVDRREQENNAVVINQIHARHILIKVNELTSDRDAREEILQLKERIEQGANFAELAKLHSEDGSASSGGDLGWLSPGNTVPPFEKAMNQLLPGQISDPVKTQFGWHLIQVIERREQDVSDEHQRENARLAIRNRKAEVVVQEMLRQLRDQAYVEYRADDI